ncbi:patatin-like phospholipase family protein [Motiliproteus coralliicola]|uniref:Patatin-like phospholipase family protein n=1 Tax=Motiliproteus coralliicola TaxID=2283196 RepID=A0A369WCP8_9GAMM|nr:patatin-like phospholipase family protein [Motiliproteus coralliicola]RDE19083.1 patatin-like phospholipase family protein [Motiliproteus coralliicola]
MAACGLNLALQGGGAHGAFTWGVLDRLLQQPDLELEAISGTSAGAMNAVMLAQGWLEGGPQGARDCLQRFWHAVAAQSPARWLPDTEGMEPSLNLALNQWLLRLSSQLSPYDLNPLDINPLESLLREEVAFERLRRECPFKLYLAATRVSNGKLRLFREAELDVKQVLASACLPTIHRAIEIDGDYYWDGGFAGNPALYPLIYESRSRDILLVLLTPAERPDLPTDIDSIGARVAEFGFNSAFLREMRAIAQARQQSRSRFWMLGALERRLRRLRFHLIEPDATMAKLSRASRYDTRLAFLLRLKQLGQQQAQQWLEQGGACSQRDSGVDLVARFG